MVCKDVMQNEEYLNKEGIISLEKRRFMENKMDIFVVLNIWKIIMQKSYLLYFEVLENRIRKNELIKYIELGFSILK